MNYDEFYRMPLRDALLAIEREGKSRGDAVFAVLMEARRLGESLAWHFGEAAVEDAVAHVMCTLCRDDIDLSWVSASRRPRTFLYMALRNACLREAEAAELAGLHSTEPVEVDYFEDDRLDEIIEAERKPR